MELSDQVAVVTGSARGIGKTIAMTLSDAGAHLVISDVNEEAGKETVSEITALGRKAVWFAADVSKSEQAAQLIDKAQESHRVTVLDSCIGCEKCTGAFECPALYMDREKNMAVVDQDRCIGCGTCIPVCPVNAIVQEEAP